MVSQPAPPPKLFHPATFFKVRSNFPSRFRFVLKHLHFRAYLPRFVVSMRNAGPSAGQNRRSFLQRCTLFGQAALARRVQWTKQRGEAGAALRFLQVPAAVRRKNRLSARGTNGNRIQRMKQGAVRGAALQFLQGHSCPQEKLAKHKRTAALPLTLLFRLCPLR